MGANDRAMMAFAIRWYPFGGGDEFILPEFGLTPMMFYRRLQFLITKTGRADNDVTLRQLRQFCHHKLTSAPSPAEQPAGR